FIFVSLTASHRALPSFPTRRSSDLADPPAQPPAPDPRAPRTASRHRPPADSPPAPQQRTSHTQQAHAPPGAPAPRPPPRGRPLRSEEHTSELQSRENLVCRLLLEKK